MNSRTLTRAKILHLIRWVLPPLLVLNLVMVVRLPFVRPWEEKTAMAASNGSTNPVETAQPVQPTQPAQPDKADSTNAASPSAPGQGENAGSAAQNTHQEPQPIDGAATENSPPTETPSPQQTEHANDNSAGNQTTSSNTLTSQSTAQQEASSATKPPAADAQQGPEKTVRSTEPKTAPTNELTDQIRLVNPAANRWKIGFLIDGREHWLAPGETYQLPAERERTIVFHRGGEFGEAKLNLSHGVFQFEVSKRGWNLLERNTP